METELVNPNGGTLEKLEPREKWSNRFQFLFGCVGFSVGLGNVWRFPYLCYRDGGGAFLIPYFICVLIGAIPMFVMEIAMGQWTSQGTISCWNYFCPLLKGVGFAMSFIICLHNIYYQVVLAWCFHYLYKSFTSQLPWSTCGNDWNTDSCRVPGDKTNITLTGNSSESIVVTDPATEYWQKRVLQISDGVEKMGNIQWEIALALFVSWIILYFCLWKGIKWTGKILYLTTTAPYILMAILLIRGATLPGSMDGIKYYLVPDMEKLKNTRVWVGASSQVYFSYSMGVGSLTALGSFNDFHHNFWRDSIFFAIINSGTSILSGFVIFSVLGFMSHTNNIPISEVAESGPGLAFIAYPKAVTQLPGSSVWSVFFFIMLLLLGMDSQFGTVEGFVTAMIDLFPKLLRRKFAREIFLAVYVLICFLVGLTMCTNGGMYIFLLFDYYSQARTLLVVAFFQITGITWFYGINKFYDNVELMLGFKIGIVMKWFWALVTPLFNLAMSILMFYNYSNIVYNRTYEYPAWALGLGWLMSMSSVVLIPITAIVLIVMSKGSLVQRIKTQLEPKEVPVEMRSGQKYALGSTTNPSAEPMMETKDV